MAPRSPPSTSTSAREKSSSNGLSMTNNNTNKTGTLTVDNADSDLCKLSLETSCEKSHGLENNPGNINNHYCYAESIPAAKYM